MSDEIKEILDDLKFTSEQTNARLEFTQKGCETLLDYITNLQEENEILTNARYNIDRIELERRIDKAIEYIKEDMYGEPNELYGLVDGEHLLNILTGGDKE